jgi:hypothetical protein
MAETNLHPEGPDAIGELSELERACILALRKDAASRVPPDPEALRLKQEQAELRAMAFAARTARAAINSHAILEAIDMGGLMDTAAPENRKRHLVGFDLLRAARLDLAACAAPGAPGWDEFGDVLAKHGLDLFEPTEPEAAVWGPSA